MFCLVVRGTRAAEASPRLPEPFPIREVWRVQLALFESAGLAPGRRM